MPSNEELPNSANDNPDGDKSFTVHEPKTFPCLDSSRCALSAKFYRKNRVSPADKATFAGKTVLYASNFSNRTGTDL
ncbi:MAG TPA: hypothetical protein VK612_02920 [Pyrinomonadaceae bacterium]|nr:hypothetical protein [Pyrinomonadaceae bacterium]